ncbi:hypothetical protein [uncultured Jatrophihabitans sp.]|uniref:hypothetical protein n=1 Tax=uncultured Jatrophihabitans sp. TaxID=1610747 RepID=UPI0035CB412A
MASLETVVSADAARSMWKWRGSLAGVPVVTSAHGYVRRVECARGLAQFMLALERAQPDAGIIRHFGARSLREYENEPAFSMHLGSR